MIGRPDDHSRGLRAGHIGKIALERFALRDLFLVILVARGAEGIALDARPIEGDRTVSDLVKRHLRIERSDAHAMALGAFQKKAARAEERIGAPALFDLLRNVQ